MEPEMDDAAARPENIRNPWGFPPGVDARGEGSSISSNPPMSFA